MKKSRFTRIEKLAVEKYFDAEYPIDMKYIEKVNLSFEKDIYTLTIRFSDKEHIINYKVETLITIL